MCVWAHWNSAGTSSAGGGKAACMHPPFKSNAWVLQYIYFFKSYEYTLIKKYKKIYKKKGMYSSYTVWDKIF